MRQINSIIVLIFLLFFFVNVHAQEKTRIDKNSVNNKGMYLSGQLSTNGWGSDIRYVFNKTFTLKAGFEQLNLTSSMDFNENEIDYVLDLNYRTGGIFVMADINYTRNLYITIGAAQNSLNPKINGVAADDVPYGDIVIPAEMIGDFTFALSPSMKISPYAGLGFRGFMGAKQRIVYFFETGFYYLGPPKVDIEATGLLAPTADPIMGQDKVFEKQFSQYQFYPVVKLNLAIKLF